MSLAAMTWAFAQRGLKPTEKVILLALADYANDEGYCFPGQVSIAAKADLSERTVRDTLHRLEVRGLLEIEERRRESGYKTSNGYRLQISPATSAGDQISPADSRKSHRQTAAGQEPSGEPSGNTPPTPSTDDPMFEAVWGMWPRKDNRKMAERYWNRLTVRRQAEIVPKLQAHGRAHRVHTPPKFIPMLSTWLNQERWDDPLPVAQDRGGRTVEPETRKGITIPAGHVPVRDENGYITGSRPA